VGGAKGVAPRKAVGKALPTMLFPVISALLDDLMYVAPNLNAWRPDVQLSVSAKVQRGLVSIVSDADGPLPRA